jgi:hypothetical protein
MYESETTPVLLFITGAYCFDLQSRKHQGPTRQSKKSGLAYRTDRINDLGMTRTGLLSSDWVLHLH